MNFLKDNIHIDQMSKKKQVIHMFNRIANYYDFLNHFLSFNMDKKWRTRAIDELANYRPKFILDVATGTADFAIEAVKLNPEKIIGIDISDKMLEIAKVKIQKKNLSSIIELQKGDSENLSFADNTFDAVTVAFGVRNFSDLQTGLKEIFRVLKTGGRVIVLEFSKPNNVFIKPLFNFYFNSILPFLGNKISKDKKAYKYLPDSVREFPDGVDFINILERVGFRNTSYKILTFGICSIYIGEKSEQGDQNKRLLYIS
ncbi:MAG: bifunctional demethylmenaquinone methyltransferase/2-methoxy-6-polyprenyl-1,4-benzoquinol methylase UbiE [Thermodesulfovibrionales bacterium]|nr:bifunctional demethylmenaquinone methyltransferase/2-methoxy-6-polyprenyl-1,4-benzoquinol methylase UbiE [Thermodesulfovibrionales bacterium]